MAGTLEKLIADMRMAQGLEPDPLADDLAPAAALPADIRPPELSADTSAQIDASMAGIEPPTGTMLPEAVESPVPADSQSGSPVDPFPSPASTSQSVASSEKDSSSTIVGNRKYAQGGAPVTPGAVSSIVGSSNPEAQASQLAIDEATQRRNDAVSLFEDQAALEADQAMKEKQVLAADDRIRQDEMARQVQFQQEAENRIAEVDMEIQEIAEREPDPSRFWSSRSAGQQALYMLTAALQAFSKPDEVPKVAEVLSKFIDQDIKIQEDRLSRELAAAQGRGRSVRELITMGKEKDAALYALRRGSVESLSKMLDADMRQKGAPLKAQESVQRANEALGLLSAGWYKEAAAGERSNREMIFRKQEAAKERAFKASEAEKERKARADEKKLENGDAAPVVRISGVENGITTAGGERDGVVLNPTMGKEAIALVSDTVRKHNSAAKLFAKLYTVNDRIRREGRSAALDKELSDLLVASAGQMAKMGGDTGALSEGDMVRNMKPFGTISFSNSGEVLGVSLLKSAQTNPDSIQKYLDYVDDRLRAGSQSMLSTATHPDYPKPTIATGKDIYLRESAQAAEADKAESASRLKSYVRGAEPSGIGQAEERAVRAVSGGLFLPKDELSIATSKVADMGREGSGVKTRDAFLSEVIGAKVALQDAIASAPSAAEKARLGLRLGKLEAIQKVSEVTPEGMSPKQFLSSVREQLKTNKSILSGKRPNGSNMHPLGGLYDATGNDPAKKIKELEEIISAYKRAGIE